jgi:hypothetical protein
MEILIRKPLFLGTTTFVSYSNSYRKYYKLYLHIVIIILQLIFNLGLNMPFGGTYHNLCAICAINNNQQPFRQSIDRDLRDL